MHDVNRCYLLCGPESAGNRLVARMLLAAGCRGRAAPRQPFDVPGDWHGFQPPSSGRGPIVWIRSFPHGHPPVWVSLDKLCLHLLNKGYSPHLIVTVRDPHCMARSQRLTHRHGADWRRAYRMIVSDIVRLELPWDLAVHESFVAGGLPAVNCFLQRLGLCSLERFEEIRDENAKHHAAGAAVGGDGGR